MLTSKLVKFYSVFYLYIWLVVSVMKRTMSKLRLQDH